MNTTHKRGDLLHHNQYRIEGILGIGGQGIVYRAQHLKLGIAVAIKELFDPSADTREHFLQQAQLLVQLKHPALPGVMDFFELNQQAYLVMEFIAGEDLDQQIAQQGIQPVGQVLEWADKILDALHYLHSREPEPIIHRDIKPANLKVTPNGHLYLVDFGLVKVGDVKKSTHFASKGYTEGFAPPEQYGIGYTGPRSDIYALGATLYYLLTAQLPRAANIRASGVELIPLNQINPTVPPSIVNWIEKAMSVNRNERWTSAAQMRSMMTTLPAGTAVMPPPVSPASQKRFTTAPPEAKHKQQRYTTGVPVVPIEATRKMDSSSKPLGASQPISQQARQAKRRNRGLIALLGGLAAILLIAIIGFGIMTIVANNSTTPTAVAENNQPVSSVVVISNNSDGSSAGSTSEKEATPTAIEKPSPTKTKEVSATKINEVSATKIKEPSATKTKAAIASPTKKNSAPTASPTKKATPEATATRRTSETVVAEGSRAVEVEPTKTLSSEALVASTQTLPPTATQARLPTATQAPLPTATQAPLPTATQAPLPTATQAPLPTATQPPPPTATQPPPPTLTLPPPPTLTLPPPPTLTLPPPPTATTPPLPTNTPVPAAPANYSTGPNVLEPANGKTLSSENVIFKWSWSGGALTSGQTFLVKGFRDGQWVNLGTTTTTQLEVWLSGFGNFETNWEWYVVVLDSGGNEISPRSATFSFGVSLSSGGGNSGGGDTGGGDTGGSDPGLP